MLRRSKARIWIGFLSGSQPLSVAGRSGSGGGLPPSLRQWAPHRSRLGTQGLELKAWNSRPGTQGLELKAWKRSSSFHRCRWRQPPPPGDRIVKRGRGVWPVQPLTFSLERLEISRHPSLKWPTATGQNCLAGAGLFMPLVVGHAPAGDACRVWYSEGVLKPTERLCPSFPPCDSCFS